MNTSEDSRLHEFKPRQIVLVLLDDPASGATLGYQGNVVCLDRKSVREHSDQPDRWKYVVHVPQLGKHFRIGARLLVATDDWDSVDPLVDSVCEVRFDNETAEDNLSVSGRFRVSNLGLWNTFQFVKTDDAAVGFRVAMPVAIGSCGPGRLSYSVPSGEVLDREYVCRAIGKLCRRLDIRDVTPN